MHTLYESFTAHSHALLVAGDCPLKFFHYLSCYGGHDSPAIAFPDQNIVMKPGERMTTARIHTTPEITKVVIGFRNIMDKRWIK